MEKKTILKIILVVQILVLVFTALSALGVDIPFVRPALGFIYLTFVPGLVILFILKIYRIRIVETILYSVGLSLAFTMFLGLIINILYPLLGISEPISIWPLTLSMAVVLLILYFFAYRFNRNPISLLTIKWRQWLSPPILIMVLLPTLSILGAQLVNIYHSNIVLLITLGIIAVTAIIVVSTKIVPEHLYPFAIFTIGLALLYHMSLISNYLTGWDIHSEYYYANQTLSTGHWDNTLAHVYNSSLSVNILAPSYSLICGMTLTQVFKIIYPFLYAMVPLGLFEIFKKQNNNKSAFLAAFLFMSIITFYYDMISLARQQTAEIFLTVLLLVVVNNTHTRMTKSILFLIFSASLIVSHYSSAYLVLFFLLALLIYRALKQVFFSKKTIVDKKSNSPQNQSTTYAAYGAPSGNNVGTIALSATAAILYIVVCLSWYLWQSGESAFIALVNLIDRITSTFLIEFFNIGSSQALSLIAMQTVSPLHQLYKYVHLLIQFFITIGFIQLIITWKRKRANEDFAVFMVVSFFLLLSSIALPYLSSSLNTSRIYHFALIFLAPLCIAGAFQVADLFNIIVKRIRPSMVFSATSIIIAVLLLFGTGFIYEIAKDHPTSIALSQNSIKQNGNDEEKALFYSALSMDYDVVSAMWSVKELPQESKVYATFSNPVQVNVLTSYGNTARWRQLPLTSSLKELENGTYVYLQYLNVVESLGTELTTEEIIKRETFNFDMIKPLLLDTNKIYTNSGSTILKVPSE